MARDVKIGILVPTHFKGELPTSDRFIEFFKAVEILDFDAIWVLDRIFSYSKVLDAMMVLAWAAGVTTRVRLGVGVLLLPHRSPVLLAKEVATLDYMSGGRLDLGLGLGRQEVEFTSLGMSMKERVGRFRENLEIMRKLWSETDVSYQGRFHNIEWGNTLPHPVQSPLPIYIGGEVDAVLKRTVDLADGWIGGSRNNPETFGEKYRKLREFAETKGRDPDELDCGNLSFIAVTEDVKQGQELLRECTTSIYGDQYDSDTYTTAGSAEDCATRLQAFIDAGATNLMVGMPTLDVDHLTRVAQEVMPKLNR